MKKARRLLSPTSRLAIALAVLSAGLSLRCGSEETAPGSSGGVAGSAGQPSNGEPGGEPAVGSVCEPFATRRCIGPAACTGGQACSKDGSAWSTCDCGDAPRGAAGAGGADGGAEGGGGGSAGTIANPVACQPAPQSGCDADEKCSVVVVTATQSFSFQCVADGTKAEGAECALRQDGTDDCAQGFFCNGIGTVPRCHPYCDVTNPNSCDTLCTEVNVGHGGVSVPSGYGVCQPACDLLAQNCDEGDACVFVGTPFPVCAKAGLAQPGETCVYYDDCEVGSACALRSATELNARMCTPLCEATQAGSCGAAGDTCLAFPMFDATVPENLFTTGLCYPCALLPIPDCALLAPGGCAEEADCEPLLASMGLPYTCDALAGVCVMAEPPRRAAPAR